MPEAETQPSAEAAIDMSVSSIVEQLKLVRVRYDMPDTSAYVRYLGSFHADPTELTVIEDYRIQSHVNAEQTGEFRLPDLVNVLNFAYLQVHLFRDKPARDHFLIGFDDALSQLEFIGGTYDFNRLWLTKGVSNIGIPITVFYGQRNAINGQPSITLFDHRQDFRGKRVYRAISGSGHHVGEEYFDA